MNGSLEERQRRQKIRAWVTVAALLYAFGGGILLLVFVAVDAWFGWHEPGDNSLLRDMRETFLMVLPLASAAITFWFTSKDDNSN